MVGVLSCLGHFFKLLFCPSERKGDREPTVVKHDSMPVTVGVFAPLQPLKALGGRELHVHVRDLRARQDRRIQYPNLVMFILRLLGLSSRVLPAVTHCPFSHGGSLTWVKMGSSLG